MTEQTGEQLRDIGMATAELNAEDWCALAMLELEEVWKSKRHDKTPWLFEAHKWHICRAIGGAKNWSKCAGVLAKEARKRGWVDYAGAGTAKNSSGHASLRRSYVWL
jgi:hypothetical protein